VVRFLSSIYFALKRGLFTSVRLEVFPHQRGNNSCSSIMYHSLGRASGPSFGIQILLVNHFGGCKLPAF